MVRSMDHHLGPIATLGAAFLISGCGGGGGSTSTPSNKFLAEAVAVTWSALANEGADFTVDGTQTVRFGGGTAWVQRSVTSSGSCTTGFFGADPIPGVVKQCELSSTAAPAPEPVPTWRPLVNEGADFTVDGTQTVRYGSDTAWVQRSVTTSGSCTNDFFGTDPIPGTAKRCELLTTTAVEPPPPPTPTPTPGHGMLPPNPRMNEGFSVDRIQATDERAFPSGDKSGDFRTRCVPSHYAFDDPIALFGQPGKSHLHVFFGNTGADAYSTAESIATSGNSTCRGGTVNRSSYWVPVLVDTGTNLPVQPDESDFYYKSGYMGVSPASIQPMPAGLRMIAGDAHREASAAGDNSHYTWVCHNAGTNRGQGIPNCEVGDQLELSIAFPQCWDGRNLDSSDHKSHMAYGLGGDNGGCPGSHPIPLPEVSFHVLYPITEPNQTAKWRLSSDADSGPAGYSAHADWFNGWKKDVSDSWSRNCVAAGLDCHSHLIGDGRAIF